jgi:hypothetical protein
MRLSAAILSRLADTFLTGIVVQSKQAMLKNQAGTFPDFVLKSVALRL